jgi:hypothetical protein
MDDGAASAIEALTRHCHSKLAYLRPVGVDNEGGDTLRYTPRRRHIAVESFKIVPCILHLLLLLTLTSVLLFCCQPMRLELQTLGVGIVAVTSWFSGPPLESTDVDGSEAMTCLPFWYLSDSKDVHSVILFQYELLLFYLFSFGPLIIACLLNSRSGTLCPV